jgi:putative methyltransferase, YaeB/AF_0241 family
MEVIARIHNDFPTKFGLPRQSGLAPSLRSKIVFEPAFRIPEALRGLDGFSHIWLIWGFSESEGWSPTVRPPRLGGNVRMGVFATRSPFRPNPIGLSSVRLEGIETDGENGLVLIVTGADLMDGTPIFDIKPYVTYADSIPQAKSGFVDEVEFGRLRVVFPEELRRNFSPEQADTLTQVLENDPRPRVQADADKVFGMPFAGHDVRFRVEGTVLTVVDVVEQGKRG